MIDLKSDNFLNDPRTTGLNSQSSFATGCLIKVKELLLS